MLSEYAKLQRPRQPVNNYSTTFRKTFCIPIILCCVILVTIVIVVPLALIPLYLSNHQNSQVSSENNNTLSADQQLTYEIPSNFTLAQSSLLKDGELNSVGLKRLQEIMQSGLNKSSNDAMSTSQLIVKRATITVVNSTNASRKRRDASWKASGIVLTEVSNQQASVQKTILNIWCTLVYRAQYSSYSPAVFTNLLRNDIQHISLPFTVLTLTGNTTCTDTPGYVEESTGHTCQTYVDYGFCSGSKILMDNELDVKEAQENCCQCGKES